MVAVQHIHDLVGRLSDEDREVLANFLERFSSEDDPVERAFLRAALLEPEDLSEEDKRALKEAEDALAAGDVFTQEEIEREFLDES